MRGFKVFFEAQVGQITLTPLYRGIAGPYQKGQGVQYYTNDLNLAIDYADKESKRQGQPPFVVQINVPSQTITRYRSKSTGQNSEVYDIPADVADRFSPKQMDMATAQHMAQQHQAVQDAGSQNVQAVIFRGQGADATGAWMLYYAQMGKPVMLKAVVKAVRDAVPQAITNPALQQRMQVKGEVPVMVITQDGPMQTTMPAAALQVMKQQTSVPRANASQYPPGTV